MTAGAIAVVTLDHSSKRLTTITLARRVAAILEHVLRGGNLGLLPTDNRHHHVDKLRLCEKAWRRARHALAFRVGKATVYALAKSANEDWGEVAMSAAFSKESLSIAADNYEESLSFVRRNVRDKIKLERVAA